MRVADAGPRRDVGEGVPVLPERRCRPASSCGVVGEVGVDRVPLDPRPLGDPADRGPRRPDGRVQLHRRLDDPLPRLRDAARTAPGWGLGGLGGSGRHCTQVYSDLTPRARVAYGCRHKLSAHTLCNDFEGGAMQAIDLSTLELMDLESALDPTRRIRVAFPISSATGTAASASVYFEVEPGDARRRAHRQRGGVPRDPRGERGGPGRRRGRSGARRAGRGGARDGAPRRHQHRRRRPARVRHLRRLDRGLHVRGGARAGRARGSSSSAPRCRSCSRWSSPPSSDPPAPAKRRALADRARARRGPAATGPAGGSRSGA